MTSNCSCGGLIVPASNDPDDIAAAVLAHNRTERHRVGTAYPEPPSHQVYVEPARAPAAVSIVLGPTPCHGCGQSVTVERFPGGALATVHPRGSLACTAAPVASS